VSCFCVLCVVFWCSLASNRLRAGGVAGVAAALVHVPQLQVLKYVCVWHWAAVLLPRSMALRVAAAPSWRGARSDHADVLSVCVCRTS
jgi:hypothetical protein